MKLLQSRGETPEQAITIDNDVCGAVEDELNAERERNLQ